MWKTIFFLNVHMRWKDFSKTVKPCGSFFRPFIEFMSIKLIKLLRKVSDGRTCFIRPLFSLFWNRFAFVYDLIRPQISHDVIRLAGAFHCILSEEIAFISVSGFNNALSRSVFSCWLSGLPLIILLLFTAVMHPLEFTAVCFTVHLNIVWKMRHQITAGLNLDLIPVLNAN